MESKAGFFFMAQLSLAAYPIIYRVRYVRVRSGVPMIINGHIRDPHAAFGGLDLQGYGWLCLWSRMASSMCQSRLRGWARFVLAAGCPNSQWKLLSTPSETCWKHLLESIVLAGGSMRYWVVRTKHGRWCRISSINSRVAFLFKAIVAGFWG